MEINVFFDKGCEGYIDGIWLKKIAERILLTQDIGTDIEMGIVITNQKKIRQLNKEYRGKDKPTDVLAFAMFSESSSGPNTTFFHPLDGVKHIGEVIVSYPQATIQAEENLHSIQREVALLLIHGILHLIGYDHTEHQPSLKMATREQAILNTIKGDLL
jgi:probable rRNA maturation factor